MTNQNDTQDEAERLAEVMIASLVTMNNRPVHRPDVLKYAFKAGYRAGVASKEAEIASLKHDLATKSSTDLISEKYRLREQLADSRAEVEQLQSVVTKQKDYVGESAESATALREQLAAEKAKADEIKIGSCELLTAIFRVKDHSQKEVMNKADRLGKILSHKIEFYSTDSGDGVG